MPSISHKNIEWIDISNPTEEDILELKKNYKFHELDLEDCLSGSQRPKIDEYSRYLFIILQFPYYRRRTHHLSTEHLRIFIGQDYLITVHNDHLSPIKHIFEECTESPTTRKRIFGDSTGYLLYSVISALFTASFSIIDQIQVNLKKMEMEIFEGAYIKDKLFDIMTLKKNIIMMRQILLPQRSVIATLEHKQKRFLPDHLEVYFDDVVDKIETQWNILETQKEVIEALEDTNESLLSHNINNTIRTLTVFSAIMLPLTVLTGLFGMNVKLPFFQALENIHHFWSIVVSMVLVTLALAALFKWKKWL
ncbi:magnesium transporter CorA family protein [Candidatus Peregrinibacteria bacterium]|nr:MAG: magnesium transporter CorA family protein [Candidatus Peregrinibacteria bacterium]